MKYNSIYKLIYAKYAYTRAMHPDGRCLRALLPEDKKNGTIVGFIFKKMLRKNATEDFSGYQIYLTDPFSRSELKDPSFQMQGDVLSALVENKGYMNYKTRISETVYLENDPNFKCKSLNFDVKFRQLEQRHDRYGLYIQFEDTIVITTSTLAINAKTLITRIGGIIGVGKELLWVVVFLCVTLQSALTLIKQIGKF